MSSRPSAIVSPELPWISFYERVGRGPAGLIGAISLGKKAMRKTRLLFWLAGPMLMRVNTAFAAELPEACKSYTPVLVHP